MYLMRHQGDKLVKNTKLLVEQSALMSMLFGNDHGVRLMEHVRYLERIRYSNCIIGYKCILYKKDLAAFPRTNR